MALLKKVNSNWYPKEKEGEVFEIGDTIDITDYRKLVESGNAVLVDEEGNELPLPGTTYTCPVCARKTTDIGSFIAHANSHQKAPTAKVSTAQEAPAIVVADDIKAKRLAALEKARQVRLDKLAAAQATEKVSIETPTIQTESVVNEATGSSQ